MTDYPSPRHATARYIIEHVGTFNLMTFFSQISLTIFSVLLPFSQLPRREAHTEIMETQTRNSNREVSYEFIIKKKKKCPQIFLHVALASLLVSLVKQSSIFHDTIDGFMGRSCVFLLICGIAVKWSRE